MSFYAIENECFCPKCKRLGLKIKMREFSKSYIHFTGKIKWEIYYKCPKCGWYKKRED